MACGKPVQYQIDVTLYSSRDPSSHETFKFQKINLSASWNTRNIPRWTLASLLTERFQKIYFELSFTRIYQVTQNNSLFNPSILWIRQLPTDLLINHSITSGALIETLVISPRVFLLSLLPHTSSPPTPTPNSHFNFSNG